MEVKMKFERETKGAVRFQEVDSNGNAVEVVDGVIGTLYVRKTALGGKVPTTLTLTIQTA